MMRRHELTDARWEKIAPLLAASGMPGEQWADHRTVISGDLPECHGPWQAAYERHRRWPAGGLARALDQEQQEREQQEREREWAVNIDSTSCRAHQHAAGARTGRRVTSRKGGARAGADGREALGRSRAG